MLIAGTAVAQTPGDDAYIGAATTLSKIARAAGGAATSMTLTYSFTDCIQFNSGFTIGADCSAPVTISGTVTTPDVIEFLIMANDGSRNCSYTPSVGTPMSSTSVTDAIFASYCVPTMTATAFKSWIESPTAVGWSVVIRPKNSTTGVYTNVAVWD